MKEGGALMHVYVLEHIISLSYRTSWWMFTKFDRDEVLIVTHLCIGFSATSTQGQIQGGAICQNRSMKGSFSKGLLQIRRLQQQTEYIAVISKHMGRSIIIFGSILKLNFWRVDDVFLHLVILVYFNAISIDLYAIRWFICIYFV